MATQIRHGIQRLMALGALATLLLLVPATDSHAQPSLAADLYTTCEVDDGAVYCWGSNRHGQADPRSDERQVSRTRIAGLPRMQSVGVGYRHACGLAEEGAVWCWGHSRWAQLGAVGAGPAPVSVPGVAGATSLSVGQNTNCAVVVGGAVRCWGYSPGGILGIRQLAVPPRTIPNLRPTEEVSVGHDHICARVRGGRVYCWGKGLAGQLGNRSSARSQRPIHVRGLGGPATAVAAGSAHSCAIVQERLFCWGAHMVGETPDSAAARGTPQHLASFGAVRSVALGKGSTCAIQTDGTALCAGVNGVGQTGLEPVQLQSEPRPVAGLGPSRELALGYYHGCARGEDGAVACWGMNTQGQAGQPPAVPASRPRAVRLPAPAAQLSAAELQTCVVLEDGRLFCWGRDIRRGSRISRDTTLMGFRPFPTEVAGMGPVREARTSGPQTCGATPNGEVRCVVPAPNPTSRPLPRAERSEVRPVEVRADAGFALGGFNGCAVAEGELDCWGGLGEGISFDRLGGAPFAVAQFVTNAVTHCARSTDGRVACWGSATNGLLGDGSERPRDQPALVPSVRGSLDLAISAGHACLVTSEGGVQCWGNPRRGATGRASGPAHMPAPVAGLRDVSRVAVGNEHSCALTRSGEVYCWGRARYGQTGQGYGRGDPTPRRVDSLPPVVEIALGEEHSCARGSGGQVYCWGRSAEGELGDGQGFLILPAARVGSSGPSAPSDGRGRTRKNEAATTP